MNQEPAGPDAPGTTLRGASLGTVHAIGQSLAVGPIFSAGLLTATVASVSGFNTPLAVLLAFLGSLGLAYVIAMYARRYAGAGAVYEYLSREVGSSFGAFSAVIYLLGLLMLGAGGIYIGIGYLTQDFFATHLSVHIPFWVGGAAALIIGLVLNYRGVKFAVSGVLALAGLSSIPFIVLSVAIIAKGGAQGNSLGVFNPSHTSWNAVLDGVLFAVTLFIGFEASAAIAEETRNPHRSIPVAVLATVAISGVFFLLVSYAGAIGFGEHALGANNAWAASASPFGDLARRYVGGWLSPIIDLVVIIDAVSVTVAFMVAAARVMFALSRDSVLPRWLGRTSPYGTPVAGNVVIAVVTVAMLIWAGLTHYGAAIGLPNSFTAFLILNAAGSYLVQLVYVFLAVFAFRLAWRSGRNVHLVWKILAIIAGLAMPLLAFKGSLDPFPHFPLNRGAYIAAGLVALPAVWWLVLRMRNRVRIPLSAVEAADHDEASPEARQLP